MIPVSIPILTPPAPPPQNLNPQVEHTYLENLATLVGINIAPSHH